MVTIIIPTIVMNLHLELGKPIRLLLLLFVYEFLINFICLVTPN